MKSWEAITITDIQNVLTVPSVKGETMTMRNRPWYGLSFCAEGEIHYCHQGKTFVSAPGAAILLPKGADYTLYRTKTGLFPLINFQCTGLQLDTFSIIPLARPDGYLNDFKRLYDAFTIKQNRICSMGILYEILDKLRTDCTPQSGMLQPALNEIEHRLDDATLSGSVLAARCGISEVYFRRLFREQIGLTPKQYVLQMRMRNAKRLLAETNLSIGAVAEACGFSNPYHFSRTFHKQTGITPSAYRQMQYHEI